MLPNQITLSVDVLNDGNTVAQLYDRHEEYLNRSVYVSESHSIAAKDTLSIYRTMPKQNGNFRGTAKSTCKFSQDVPVTGANGETQVAQLIAEVHFSVPVGVLAPKTLEFRQRLVALLDSEPVASSIVDKLSI